LIQTLISAVLIQMIFFFQWNNMQYLRVKIVEKADIFVVSLLIALFQVFIFIIHHITN